MATPETQERLLSPLFGTYCLFFSVIENLVSISYAAEFPVVLTLFMYSFSCRVSALVVDFVSSVSQVFRATHGTLRAEP
jgi:hypothetical protein